MINLIISYDDYNIHIETETNINIDNNSDKNKDNNSSSNILLSSISKYYQILTNKYNEHYDGFKILMKNLYEVFVSDQHKANKIKKASLSEMDNQFDFDINNMNNKDYDENILNYQIETENLNIDDIDDINISPINFDYKHKHVHSNKFNNSFKPRNLFDKYQNDTYY